MTEYIAGARSRLRAAAKLVVAYHAACSLQHGQKIIDAPKALLRRAGFEVRTPAESHLCCGSAGIYNLLQPRSPAKLRDRKVANIARLKPDVIAAGNIGCITQIGSGTTIPSCTSSSCWTGRRRPEARRDCLRDFWPLVSRFRGAGASTMSFQGFGPKALPFLKALGFHQTKEWFEANRATYESDLKTPLGDLVEDLTASFAKRRFRSRATAKARCFAFIATCGFRRTRAPTRPTRALP